MTRRPALLLALLAALLPAAARADGWSPLGFSIGAESNGGIKSVYGFPSYDCEVDGLRLALFGSANVRMQGVSIGALANGFGSFDGGDGNVAGIQVAGLFNFANAANYGVIQAAGFCNGVYGAGAGIQIASFANMAHQWDGFQIAGIMNVVKGPVRGVQIAGLINRADDLQGIQIGAINYASKKAHGLQLGFFNRAGVARGFQIGVINWVDKDIIGFQIGLINSVGTLDGAQIGAFNFVDDGFDGAQIGILNEWNEADPAVIPFLRIYF